MKTLIGKLYILTFVYMFLLIVIAILLSANIKNPDKCVQLTWHRTMTCQQNTNYTAGKDAIILTGKVPADNIWGGKYFSLKGYLMEGAECTLFVVEKAKACSVSSDK